MATCKIKGKEFKLWHVVVSTWIILGMVVGACWGVSKAAFTIEDRFNQLFNKNVKTCDANNNGCSNLIRTKRGIGTNLVKNGGFELGVISPDGWTWNGGDFNADNVFAGNNPHF